MAENVGFDPTGCSNAPFDGCSQLLFNMMFDERLTGYDGAGHYKNIVNANFRYQGVGAYVDSNGGLWLTQDFLNCFNNSCPVATYAPTATTNWTLNGTSTIDSSTSAVSKSTISVTPGQKLSFVHAVKNLGGNTATYPEHYDTDHFDPSGGQVSHTVGAGGGVGTGWYSFASPFKVTTSFTIPASAINGEKYCQYLWYSDASGPSTAGETSNRPCGKVVTAAAPAGSTNTLTSGQALTPGQGIYSPNGYKAIFQADGNFVIYNALNQVLWSSGTGGKGGVKLTLQTNGDLTMRNSSGTLLWHTGTTTGVHLDMQTGGNLVLYNATNGAIWFKW
jgi:hypothetical protein